MISTYSRISQHEHDCHHGDHRTCRTTRRKTASRNPRPIVAPPSGGTPMAKRGAKQDNEASSMLIVAVATAASATPQSSAPAAAAARTDGPDGCPGCGRRFAVANRPRNGPSTATYQRQRRQKAVEDLAPQMLLRSSWRHRFAARQLSGSVIA